MKKALLLAATVLLGCTSAKVHRLKLNKVPLSDQLVSYHRSTAVVDPVQDVISNRKLGEC